MTTRFHLACLALAAAATTTTAAPEPVAPPPPFGPIPTERQIAWHELEFYGFLHFTTNTFTDKEWGYGDEPESVFDPSALDASQWARVAKDAGMKALIITAKHHDGFCLWPSDLTQHSVKNSPWKAGKGDVLRDLSDACRDAGLRFGVYLSPWDRNHADYARPAYVQYYHAQAAELLTKYGPIFEFWLDGANGGDGYYAGAREKRQIDRRTYYQFPELITSIRTLQPEACIFSDMGPDIRWVGNESGYAGETNWARYTPKGRDNPDSPAIGETRYEEGESGHPDGISWMPAEVDVSIRPGWFFHENENDKVKSPERLVELWYASVGRGANLLLNVPPDRRGLIHENDIAALTGMRKALAATFETNLALNRRTLASVSRGTGFEPTLTTDANPQTYWAAPDDARTADITLDLGAEVAFDVVKLREFYPLGQRIQTFTIEALVPVVGTEPGIAPPEGVWREIFQGTTIGVRRIVRVPATVATKVRVRITSSLASPTLSEISLYKRP
jgi:alpha-L-fucosidase